MCFSVFFFSLCFWHLSTKKELFHLVIFLKHINSIKSKKKTRRRRKKRHYSSLFQFYSENTNNWEIESNHLHYQKIDKYKRKYWGNISVGKFPRDFTDGTIPLVYTEGIIVGKKLMIYQQNYQRNKFRR